MAPARVPSLRSLLRAALWLGTALTIARPTDAQEQAAPRPWRAEGELGGSLFFGNSSAVTLTARSAAARTDSVREIAIDGAYTYGEATDRDGVSFVSKRSWAIGGSFDYHPLERWSPFLFARTESSLEQRVELRHSLGAGAKFTFVNSQTSSADLSLALLGERTNPSDALAREPTSLLRWSARLRGRKALAGGRVTLATESSWRPDARHLDEFTFTSASSLGFVLSDRISLKLSVLDSYDTEAEGRGARSNNDGQLLLSVLGTL